MYEVLKIEVMDVELMQNFDPCRWLVAAETYVGVIDLLVRI
jgi:hypothetical protein